MLEPIIEDSEEGSNVVDILGIEIRSSISSDPIDAAIAVAELAVYDVDSDLDDNSESDSFLEEANIVPVFSKSDSEEPSGAIVEAHLPVVSEAAIFHYCIICMDECEEISAIQLQNCQHWFCLECLGQFCAVKIREAQIVLQCPTEKCEGIILDEEVERMVKVEDFTRLLKFKRKKEGNVLDCPRCDELTTVPKTGRVVVCLKCEHVFCSVHGDAHSGDSDCAAYEKVSKERDKESMVLIRNNTKKCPGCKIHIERSHGCNHMSCTRCQTHFCWLCGDAISDGYNPNPIHYASWNILGCAGNLMRAPRPRSKLYMTVKSILRWTVRPLVAFVLGCLYLILSPLLLPIFLIGKLLNRESCRSATRFGYELLRVTWMCVYALGFTVLVFIAIATSPLWLLCVLLFKFQMMKKHRLRQRDWARHEQEENTSQFPLQNTFESGMGNRNVTSSFPLQHTFESSASPPHAGVFV